MQAPGAGNDTAQVDVTTSSRQSTTNSSRNGGGAGARDSWHAMTSLPTSYVEHTQNIVRSYERWNDALLLLDASRGQSIATIFICYTKYTQLLAITSR